MTGRLRADETAKVERQATNAYCADELRHADGSEMRVATPRQPFGHADPKVTLGIYAHVLRRKGDTGERLDALVRAADWAATGSDTSDARPVGAGRGPTADEKTAY